MGWPKGGGGEKGGSMKSRKNGGVGYEKTHGGNETKVAIFNVLDALDN